ncbi:hypothetical protein PPGU19_095080 (plasmid) [Paraburkholderia sp. PGU19]|uniref:cupin domain-containing protein n=1 Tax=Paraburkholderia sp. PGU19 TaxID=2735434 RepID=UPI0015DBCA4E|nr:cupin domain-containing protein [Paraburkholderia sp. PGU19]BCG04940.1 hypothetical protein PPGU19_095080 [Paraburkholderia sp. PGU19]
MDDETTTSPMKSRYGIVVFREEKAESLDEAGVMVNHSSSVANAGIRKVVEAGLEEGYVAKCLFRSPDPDGFTLIYLWFKGNYVLPTHTHNTDCLYYVIAGEIHLGKQVLTAGDGFFLGADTPYGYTAGPQGVEVLEFRNSTAFDITVRDGMEKAWEKLVGICEANRELWKTQKPPLRQPKVV